MLPVGYSMGLVIKNLDSKGAEWLQEFTWPAVFLEMVASSTFSGERDVLSMVLLRICNQHQCKSSMDTVGRPSTYDAHIPRAESKATNAPDSPTKLLETVDAAPEV